MGVAKAPVAMVFGWVCAAAMSVVGVARGDAFDAARDEIQQVMVAQNVPSVVVAVARNGRIVWEQGFGWSDVARRVPADEHTLYSLASISKPITATALMVLVERGAIDLDRPLNDYLGAQKLSSPVFDVRQATVRRVANHTSGLPPHHQYFYDDERAPRPTMDESIRRYGTIVLEPGENYVYSNFGYGLLEYAIERVSGKSYAQFMADELFTPLGLRQAVVNPKPAEGLRVALRYGAGVNRSAVPFYDFDHRGASAVFMSAHDLARFAMFHLDGQIAGQRRQVLTATILAGMRDHPVKMDSEGEASYGLGWIVKKAHGLEQVGHSGSMGGVRTQLSMYPASKTVVVILTNASGVDISSIERAIVHAVLPETVLNDRKFTLPATLIGDWRGAIETYTGKTPVELQVQTDGSVLARVGREPLRIIDHVQWENEGLLYLGNLAGDVGTPDARRYPYTLNFSLKLRGVQTLNGSVSAVSRKLPDRNGNALSYWVSLSKIPAR